MDDWDKPQSQLPIRLADPFLLVFSKDPEGISTPNYCNHLGLNLIEEDESFAHLQAQPRNREVSESNL